MEQYPSTLSDRSVEGALTDDTKRDIIRVATYHRQEHSLAVVHLDAGQTDALRSSLTKPFSQAPTADFGNLDVLPLEIICEISRHLDLATLYAMAQVNRCCRSLAQSLQDCIIVVQYALQAMRVILRSGLGAYFTISDLRSALHRRNCELCGRFGSFVFLLTLARRCFACIESGSKPELLLVSEIRSLAGWDEKRLEAFYVPVLNTLPGMYSLEGTAWRRRLRLVTKKSVWEAARRNKAALPPWFLSYAVRIPDIYRFMSSTSLPFVDPASLQTQLGISCRGCEATLQRQVGENGPAAGYLLRLVDQVYSDDGFIRHFRHCDEAQSMWAASRRATVSISGCETVHVIGDDGSPK